MSNQGTKSNKRWLTFALRWGIAIAGVTWVVYNLHFSDRVKVLAPSKALVDMKVLGSPTEGAGQFRVWGSFPGEPAAEHVVGRDQVWTKSNVPKLAYRTADKQVLPVTVVAVRPESPAHGVSPKILVEDPQTKARTVIDPSQVVGKHPFQQYPLIEIGLNRMAREADWRWLLAALAVMPVSYLLTSYRWHLLLEMMDIHVRQSRTFVLNMVGAFYNTFMPGSTGGDLLKAYYASKHTPHRTRAVMSVLVDRAVGLFALIVLGGTMAAFQYHENVDCQRVAKASAVLVGVTALGALVFYHRGLRRATGLAWVMGRLPMQKFVRNAVHAMELYGRRPGRMAFVLLLCFPVHVTTIIAAMFAGKAFRLEVDPGYYWVVVPVIALVGAIPISPQGAGVMEFFAIKLLTVRHSVSVGQAVALVMSIRLVQMFWNLVAGLFVLRGGYHAPTEAEQHTLETAEGDEDEKDEEDEGPTPAPVAPLTSSAPGGPLGTPEPSVGG